MSLGNLGLSLWPSGHALKSSLFIVLGTLDLYAALQVRSHKGRVEGDNHLSCPPGHISFHAAHLVACCLGCEWALLAHVWLFIHQNPQAPHYRAALSVTSASLCLRLELGPEPGAAPRTWTS